MGFNDINLQVSGPQQPASTYKTKVLKGQVPFASQVTEPNMKYVIKHNFDLGGGSVTIPANCVLEFDGGCLKNGNIVGNVTCIEANVCKIFDRINVEGSWRIDNAYPEWFGAMRDGISDDAPYINKCIEAFADKNTTIVLSGNYTVSNVIVNKDCSIQGTLTTKLTHIGNGICVNVAPPDDITSWHEFLKVNIYNLYIVLNGGSTVGIRINQTIGSIFEKIFITGSNSGVPNIEDPAHPEIFTNPKSRGIYIDGTSSVEGIGKNSVFNNYFNRIVSNRVDIGFDLDGIISDSKFYNIESNTVGEGVRVNTSSSFNITFDDCQFVDTNIAFHFDKALVSSTIRGCNIEMYRYYGIYKGERPNSSIINIVANGITTKHDTKISDLQLYNLTSSQVSNNIIGWGAPSGVAPNELTPSQISTVYGDPVNCLIYGNRAYNGSTIKYSTKIKNMNLMHSYEWLNNKDCVDLKGNIHIEHPIFDNLEIFNADNSVTLSLRGKRVFALKEKDGIDNIIPVGIDAEDMSLLSDANIGTIIYRKDQDAIILRDKDWQWKELDGSKLGTPKSGVQPPGAYYHPRTGFLFYHTDYNKPLFYNADDETYREADGNPSGIKRVGTLAERPTGMRRGFEYLLIDVGVTKPIWWNGSIWVDATGTPV